MKTPAGPPANPLRCYRSALARIARPPSKGGEGRVAWLPVLTCAAAGGAPERAVPVAVAWHLCAGQLALTQLPRYGVRGVCMVCWRLSSPQPCGSLPRT